MTPSRTFGSCPGIILSFKLIEEPAIYKRKDYKSQEGPGTYKEWRPSWQNHGEARRKRNRKGGGGPALTVTLTDRAVFVFLMLPLKVRNKYPGHQLPSSLYACMLSGSVLSNSLRPMDRRLPASSVDGILQARIMEWVAISSSSRGSSQPRDRTLVSCIAGRFFILWATREALSCMTHPFIICPYFWLGPPFKVSDFILGGLQNHCRWWLQPWN